MKELRAICDAYRKIDFSKNRVSLATVVRVRGSSYRSPGARMLITDDGHWVGSISGGCLEGDALRTARKTMAERKCILKTYDTSDDENQPFSINLGCNGIIDVLFEPLDPEDPDNPLRLFERVLESESEVVLGTVCSGNEHIFGKKILLSYNSDATSEAEVFLQQARKDLQDLFKSKKSVVRNYEHQGEVFEVFMELIKPPLHLMIFGGGFDARPLSTLASKLGWKVTVTDECVAHIAPVFFPSADQLSLCDRKFIDREFAVDSNTVCVLMSHNYEYDRDVLMKIIHSETPYIGILGPKKRYDKMLQHFKTQNITLASEELDRIHSPIGVDIGAETPDEIAVAIVAEIMSKLSGRNAGFLKHRKGPIHERSADSDEVVKEIHD